MRFRGVILPNKSAVIEGRVIDKTKALYVQAGISTITYRVVLRNEVVLPDEDDEDLVTEIVPATAIPKADVIFDTPFAWDGSRKPANFRHVISDTVFTLDERRYQVQYTFTAGDGTVGGALVDLETEDVAGE